MNKNNASRRKGSRFLNMLLSVALVVLLLAAGGFLYSHYGTGKGFSLKQGAAQAVPAEMPLEDKVETILSRMSDEEKVGQLLVVGIDGTEVDENALALIRKYHISGVTLFDRNMDNPVQVAKLNNRLQQEALKQNANLPLFICIDQEGGLVVRMSEKVTVAPAQERLAQTGQPKDAGVWAVRTAHELKAMGVNVNFAPVVDLGADYKRSYGKNADKVTEFARAAIQGYQQEGILASIKHFPGIGKTKVDPHLDPYVIEASRETLNKEDLAPFRSLIKELDNQSFMVMVSHLKYPVLDPEYPASVSSLIMTKLLRQEMGYQGLIVTDDMEMGALTQLYPFEKMGYMAVKAGADLLLVCHDKEHQIMVYDGLLAAVKDGRIDKATLDNAVRRVIKAKLTNIRQTKVDAEAAQNIVGK